MSPRKTEPSWGDLRLGIAVAGLGTLALLVVIGLGSGRGPLRAETYTLYVNLGDAGGLRVGSPVEVGGALAGQVVDVTILPPAEAAAIRIRDSLGRPIPIPPEQDIRVQLQIEERFRPHVTTRSRAQLASLGMGGERYVKILPGDVREEPLESGATIPVVASVDLDLVLVRIGRAANEVQEIAYLGEELTGKIASGAGTAGKLVDTESPLYDRVDRFEDRAQSLIGALNEGGGIVPKWRTDGRLAAQLEALRADMAVLSDSTPALDRWSEPVELREAIHGLRASLATLSHRLDTGQGTLGRLLHDEELIVQIRVLRQGLREMMAAIQEDPMGSVNIELY